MSPTTSASPASLLRRLGAIVYDSCIAIALLIVATLVLLPLTQGKAIPPNNTLYHLYLLLVLYFFFTGFWLQGGQTLGMKAWRIYVVSLDNSSITWSQASIRFFAAIPALLLLGLGLLWLLIDPNKMAWQDHASRTKIIYVPK